MDNLVKEKEDEMKKLKDTTPEKIWTNDLDDIISML